ncbi:MAG: lipase family protein [Deltaproteobacteria bacterium]|nr:lipase family protein [Deltaproteobacteria bacterium]
MVAALGLSVAQRWLELHTRPGSGPSRIVNFDAAQADFEANWSLGENDRLSLLRALPPGDRFALLASLPGWQRSQLLGGTAVDVAKIREHRLGPAHDADFDVVPDRFGGYSGATAHALAVLARRVYEPFGDQGPGPGVQELIQQGWKIQYLGAKGSLDPADTGESSQAFIAIKGNRGLFAGRGTEPDRINDLLIDAKAWQQRGYDGHAHAGFHQAVDQLWPELLAALEKARAELPPGESLSIHLTGHSLGAAIATIAARRLASEAPELARVDGVYVFGSPRIFDAAAAKAYDEALGDRTFRFFHNRDVVARVPPPWTGYEHVGQGLFLDSNGLLRAGLEPMEIERDHLKSFFKDNAAAKLIAARGETESLWDHGMDGYVKHTFLNADQPIDGGLVHSR